MKVIYEGKEYGICFSDEKIFETIKENFPDLEVKIYDEVETVKEVQIQYLEKAGKEYIIEENSGL